MSPVTPSPLGLYLVFRLFLGVGDFLSDGVQCYILSQLGHPAWAAMTMVFPLVGVFAAMGAVCAGRWTKGDKMQKGKFVLLSLRSLTLLYEGLFESAPQMVLQLVTLAHGVHLEDFLLLTDEEARFSWPWFRGLFYLFALLFSFSSLVFTLMYYNEDRLSQDKRKFSYALLNTIFCILYRVFIAVVLFSAAPFWALAICITLYLTHLVCFKLAGQGWEAVLYSYASLIVPSGHSKEHGTGLYYSGVRERKYSFAGGDSGSLHRPTRTPSTKSGAAASISEVERAKITQESLYKRVRFSYVLHGVVSVVLLAPYVALVELYLLGKPGLVPELDSRLVVYVVPLALLLPTTVFSVLYWAQARRARDAARHWFAITPHRNRSSRASTPARHNNSINQQQQPQRPHSDTSLEEQPLQQQQHPTAPPPPYTTIGPGGDTAVHFSSTAHAQTPTVALGIHRPRGVVTPPGTRRCDKASCVTCELLIEGSAFRSQMTGKEYRFMTPVSCESEHVVYLVTCHKCRKQYVGKTDQSLKQRHYGHRREIELQSTPLGKHFAEGCGYANWRFQIIDMCDTNSSDLRRREGYWQHELMTLLPWGLNTRDELNGGADIAIKA